MKIPRRIASVVINSLKGGVVPRIGLPYITVGREAEIDALLRDDRAAIPRAYDRIRRSIESRKIPLADLAKTETLNDSPETYKRKLPAGTGRRAAAFELAIRSERDYQSGDQVTYYITGEKKKVSAVDNAKALLNSISFEGKQVLK